MVINSHFALISLILILTGCAANGGFDTGKALMIGSGALQASMLDEQSVKQAASLSAQELDNKQQIAPANSAFVTRLTKLTGNLRNYDGLNLNFKVYLSNEVNAFAMADGTVRVYSALMDIMPDDQVLAVICHEIGHVKKKHSFRQMREVLLTNVAFDAASSIGGTIGSLSASQLGALGHAAITARFSQTDELESDVYAVRALKQMKQDPSAMKRSIVTLQKKSDSSGGFLSSHPSNQKRIDAVVKEIGRL